MLATKQLREEIKICIEDREVFTTTQLKAVLEQRGYIYNKDYDVTVFSNAIASLVKQKYIISMDKEKKGNYIVLDKQNKKKMKEEEEMEKKRVNNEEIELREMRIKIEENINEFCLKIEQILDSEKPSTYGRNRKTYDDILKLVDLLKEFKFEVEK